MLGQQIVNYIQEQEKNGYTAEQIRNVLIQNGYNEQQVDETLNYVHQQASQTNQPGQTGGIKKRNIVLVYIFMFITFGIYHIYWLVSTKNEINSLGAKIPTGWLLIIPIANIFWIYKYSEGFATVLKKDNNTVLWFVLFLFISIIMPAMVQSQLNKLA
ncbi:MAG: DUF4234 domain-containing protein [Nanoarchaeota archaeon]